MNRIDVRITNSLKQDGPQGTSDLASRLGLSAATVQRSLKRLPDRLTVGRARATRHAHRRRIRDVTSPIPVVELAPTGPHQLGTLHPVCPDGFWLEAEDPEDSAFYDDLPWFLQDLRPSGYLGRQVPLRHPEFPPNILLWSADDTLRFLTHHGTDGVGALLIGEQALLAMAGLPDAPSIAVEERSVVYPQLADRALQLGPVGSSAAGEQPKFLTQVEDTHVIVKFSPADDGAAATRWADLLISEHHALQAMQHAGHGAAHSTVVVSGRTFLEVERFDRIDGGRRGQIMLGAVDAEFVGLGLGWVPVMQALMEQGRVGHSEVQHTQWRACFGSWIANSDMHLGNLSLRLDGMHLAGLAPAYDMLPMHYAPVGGEVVPRTFAPTLQTADGEISRSAWTAALDCWHRIARDDRVSDAFRAIATHNGEALGALERALGRLP